MVSFKRNAAYLFWSILVLHCIAIYFELSALRGITKLLLIPVLFSGWILPAKRAGNPVSIFVIMGLLFSLMGDFLLMLKEPDFFLLGMLAFMCTHICNGRYFYIRMGKKLPSLKKMFPVAGGLVLIAGSIFLFLLPALHDYTIPVLVYMLLITGMAILAAATKQVKSLHAIATVWFIPGALLFVFSDGLLAVNLFLLHHSFLDIPVMISYAAAQYFLVNGFVRAGKQPDNAALS